MSEWIGVEDRFPNDNEIVLVFRHNFMFDTCIFSKSYCLFFNSSRHQYDSGEITHWMPLPEPPNN